MCQMSCRLPNLCKNSPQFPQRQQCWPEKCCVTLLQAWETTVLHCCGPGESYCVTLLLAWKATVLHCCRAAVLWGPEESWFQSSLVSCAVQALGELSVPKVHCVPSQLASRLLLVPLTEVWVSSGLGVLSRKEGLKRVPCDTLSLCSMHTPQVVSTGGILFSCCLWHNYS